MKTHTTNYYNTFIEIAEDCQAYKGEIPASGKENKTIAEIQFQMLIKSPYFYTSDQILFEIYALRHELSPAELSAAKTAFFSKGQPCFRASPLPKRYGWGIHYNEDGKMAIYGVDDPRYKEFVKEGKLTVLKAMKTSKVVKSQLKG